MELVKLTEVGRLSQYSEEVVLAAIEDKLAPAIEDAPALDNETTKPKTPVSPLRKSLGEHLRRSLDKEGRPVRVTAKMHPRDGATDSVPGSTTEAPTTVQQVPLRRGKDIPPDLPIPPDLLNLVERGAPLSREQATQVRLAAKSLVRLKTFSQSPQVLGILVRLIRAALAAFPDGSREYEDTLKLLAGSVRYGISFNDSFLNRSETAELLGKLEKARRRRSSSGSHLPNCEH